MCASVSPLYLSTNTFSLFSGRRLPAQCRFVKDQSLWACLAAMAINGQELETAKEAFASIGQVDKLRASSSEVSPVLKAQLTPLPTKAEEAEQILQASLRPPRYQDEHSLVQLGASVGTGDSYGVHIDTVWHTVSTCNPSEARASPSSSSIACLRSIGMKSFRIKAEKDSED